MLFSLPEGMKLGVSLSAAQAEGGRTGSAWEAFASGRVLDGSAPQTAGAHYEKLREDMAWLRRLNAQCYRMSVSWARVVPRENDVDEDALAHYRTEFSLARDYGAEPIVTLHHFDEPEWFVRKGGFLHPDAQRDFLFFVSRVARALQGICRYFITFNEPNVYAFEGYLLGRWPPKKRSLTAPFKALQSLSRCHRAAYDCLHAILPEAMVSAAPHARAFMPRDPDSLLQRLSAQKLAAWYQLDFADRFIQGGRAADFCAFNYYARSTVGDFRASPKAGARSDLGWEISPEGLKTVCEDFYRRYRLPLLIAENGVCDGRDAYRARYLYEHLRALAETDAPITHYCHWSLIDNFEWLLGTGARFGLIHVDFDTQTRTLKDSGRFFAAVARAGGVAQEAYDRYVKGRGYPQ